MSHPDRDCEDCGVYHFPWSVHEADRRRREEELGESVLLHAHLLAVLEQSHASDKTKRDVLTELKLDTYAAD